MKIYKIPQNLKTISGFKDADTLLAKYEGILSDYQAKREEAAKAKAKRIKKAKRKWRCL